MSKRGSGVSSGGAGTSASVEGVPLWLESGCGSWGGTPSRPGAERPKNNRERWKNGGAVRQPWRVTDASVSRRRQKAAAHDGAHQ